MHSLVALQGNEINELEVVLPELKENNFRILNSDKTTETRLEPVYLDKLKVSGSKKQFNKRFKKFVDQEKDNPLFKNLIKNFQ